MSNIRLLQWRQAIPAREWEMLDGGGHVDRYLRSTAGRALADRMVGDAAVQERHVEPDPDDPWGGTRRIITWSVGVADPKDTEAFAKQLDEARAEGMRMAATMAADKAARYGGLTGPCGYVIASSLNDLSRDIEKAARDPRIMRTLTGTPDEHGRQ